jgi:hypothetical protein
MKFSLADGLRPPARNAPFGREPAFFEKLAFFISFW